MLTATYWAAVCLNLRLPFILDAFFPVSLEINYGFCSVNFPICKMSFHL